MNFNFAAAVKELKLTLVNSWKKLYINKGVEPDTAVLEIVDFHSSAPRW